MGAGPSSTGGGNTGSDAGFFISEQAKKDKKKKEQQKINDSLAGGSDYQGDVNPPKPPKKKTPIVTPKYEGGGEGGNNNTTTPKVKVAVIPKVDTAPTKVEVDQSSATDTTTVKEDDIYTRKRKVKARGRSMMTLTSAQGVKKDDNLILGRRSLLGS